MTFILKPALTECVGTPTTREAIRPMAGEYVFNFLPRYFTGEAADPTSEARFNRRR